MVLATGLRRGLKAEPVAGAGTEQVTRASLKTMEICFFERSNLEPPRLFKVAQKLV